MVLQGELSCMSIRSGKKELTSLLNFTCFPFQKISQYVLKSTSSLTQHNRTALGKCFSSLFIFYLFIYHNTSIPSLQGLYARRLIRLICSSSTIHPKVQNNLNNMAIFTRHQLLLIYNYMNGMTSILDHQFINLKHRQSEVLVTQSSSIYSAVECNFLATRCP